MLKDLSFLSKRKTNYSAGSLLSTRVLISMRLISGPPRRILSWTGSTRSGMTTRSIWITSFNLIDIKSWSITWSSGSEQDIPDATSLIATGFNLNEIKFRSSSCSSVVDRLYTSLLDQDPHTAINLIEIKSWSRKDPSHLLHLYSNMFTRIDPIQNEWRSSL